MKTNYKKTKIEADIYVNTETGELLSDEYPNLTSINEKQDTVQIDYKSYVIIDSDALEYVFKHFNVQECGRILDMANMVKGCYNLLYNKKSKEYHTKDSLLQVIAYERTAYFKFIKKLFDKHIIFYLVGKKGNKECTWIMLNPYLARKNKSTSIHCQKVFTDIRSKL